MFAVFLWIYWMLLVPLPGIGNVLACGRKDKLTISGFLPDCCETGDVRERTLAGSRTRHKNVEGKYFKRRERVHRVYGKAL